MSTPLAAVTRHAFREIRRGALVVALAGAGMSAVVAVQYRTMFAGTLDSTAVRALAANPAIRVLFGPPVALDDVGGFTVWRTGAGVQILLAVWALLAATRITRGEEDAGRADLLLAGRLRNSDLVTRRLGAVAGGTLATAAALLVAMLATGTQPAGALVYTAGVLGTGLTFAAAGTLAAQVLPNRGAATGAAVALLVVDVLLRMLSDLSGGGTPLAWLAWLTPFGLTVRTAPYADNRVTPLVVLITVAALLAAAAIATARHRDVGGALVAVRTTRRPRVRLLGSLTGFAIRRALRPTTGWVLGVAAYFLFVGALATSILQFLQDNPRFADLATTAGFPHLQTAPGLAAAMFGLLAIPAGLYAATRIAALAADETSRRWTTVLALPITRTRLAATEAATTAAGILTLAVVAGLALWAGSPVDLDTALDGALNATPVAALSLGAAVLALGWAPRAVAAIGSLPVAGGFLLLVIARSAHAPDWVAGLSPFAHLSPVPYAPPDWAATAILIAAAALLTALGLAGYTRRDLTT